MRVLFGNFSRELNENWTWDKDLNCWIEKIKKK